MSDDDDFMADSDQEYDFEYSGDEDDEQDANVDIENKYYNAKQIKTTNAEEAIEEFLGIPALEEEKGDWSVKLRVLYRWGLMLTGPLGVSKHLSKP